MSIRPKESRVGRGKTVKEITGQGYASEIPESSNEATAITNFQERAFIDYTEDAALTVDIRTQKSLFGRIDEDNNSIYPNVDKVVFEPTLGVFGFDFALTLIKQFSTEWESVQPQVSKFSVYKSPTITSQFRDVDEVLEKYYAELFEQFRAELFISGEQVSITGFDDYVSKFITFMKQKSMLFTREALIRTNKFHPDSTLLIYNLSEAPHGNDETALVDYYYDASFPAVSEFLLHHGLVLDRHSPWRFVVNLKSPQVTSPDKDREMPWTQINTKKLIADYFIPAYKSEATKAKELLVSYYNTFITTITKKKISQCSETLKPIQLDVNISPAVDSASVNLTVINFLIAVREYETKKNITSSMRQKITQELQKDINKIDAAYQVLHELMKKRQFFVPPKVMSRVDALVISNYLRCNGAHRSFSDGSWVPCKNIVEFLSKVKQNKGAPAVLESFLANINKEEIEADQEEILDIIDPF